MMSLEEFKEKNRMTGKYWFSDDTMSFFKSKVEHWDSKTGLFITSEVNPSKIKAYTIRKADFETGDVDTVGLFHYYKTLAKAKAALKLEDQGEIES